MAVIPTCRPVGLDHGALRQQIHGGGFHGLLLTSPENVFYTTGYTSLPSAGNPILYTLRIEHYRTMVGIVDEVGAALVPGTTYTEAYDTAVRLLGEHRIPLLDRFIHVGHNIGLETEEEWLGDDAESAVKAGMAINIELYSQAPTGEMIGNEETYVMHDDGPERISVLPREIYRVDPAPR
jgi:Xaa-Pro aminopeptidase